MDISIAVSLCMYFEGFRSKPYLCPAGVATIGYGTIRYPDGSPVTLFDDPLTKIQAKKLLIHQLKTDYVPVVLRLTQNLNLSQLNACIDFAYNLGNSALQHSTFRRKLNSGDIVGARIEIMRWVYGGGKRLSGLVARRQQERSLL
jgi:lysozyme